MNLELDGETLHENATADDIAAAIAKRPRAPDFDLVLEDDEDMVEASLDAAGNMHLAVDVGGEFLVTQVPDDDVLVGSVFNSVLAHDGRWRELCAWTEPPKRTDVGAKVSMKEIPIQAKFGVGFVALLALGSMFLDGPWIVLLFALAFPGIIMAAALVKMQEVKVASKWKQGRATIVKSVISGGKPDIAYDFSVGMDMVRHRGTRVSIGEIAVNDPETPKIMARFPAGANVPVFYDPANPASSVLERGMPFSPRVIWILVAVMAAVMVAMVVAYVFRAQLMALFRG